MKNDIENALTRIREMILAETPERGASIEDRIRAFQRRKAMQEILDEIEKMVGEEGKQWTN